MGESESQPLESANKGKPGTSLTLLLRLRANDADAWHTVVRLYSRLVAYWCVQGGVRGEDAEDVMQEVFRAAAVHLVDFRRTQSGDSFRSWLRGITRNRVLMHFRSNERHPLASGGTDAQRKLESFPDPVSLNEEEDPVEELHALRSRALEMVRAEFEQRTWQAFWLTVVEGRLPADIATEMGVSAAAVRMAKSRVLYRLREEFGELI
jgi:RNA polymerase sigma-70 factor, ECF subfamily